MQETIAEANITFIVYIFNHRFTIVIYKSQSRLHYCMLGTIPNASKIITKHRKTTKLKTQLVKAHSIVPQSNGKTLTHKHISQASSCPKIARSIFS